VRAVPTPLSVLLSNVYLHYVLDLWFERVVKPRLQGEAYWVRYLDDCARRKPLDLGDERSPPGDSPDAPQ
jgi:hypothetical protein